MATRTISNAGGNWSANGTWAEGSPPDATMDVVDTGTSGAVTVDTTTCVCKTLTYTHSTSSLTLTAAQKLSVSGNITLATGMTLSGTGNLTIAANGTLTPNGVTIPGDLTFAVGGTVTLGGNLVITGLTTTGTGTLTINSYQMTCNGGLAVNVATLGTTDIILGGGSWSGTNATGLANNLTLAGNITISGTVYYKTGTLTYSSGAITTTGSTLRPSASCTINTSGMTWATISSSAVGTWALTSDLKTTTLTIGHTVTLTGNYNIYCAYLNSDGEIFTWAAGTTLNVSTGIFVGIVLTTSLRGCTFKSGTASSPAYLNYQGAYSNLAILAGIFTDIDASSSAVKIYNFQGSTLTRTVNVVNVVLPAYVGGFSPVNGCSFIQGVHV